MVCRARARGRGSCARARATIRKKNSLPTRRCRQPTSQPTSRCRPTPADANESVFGVMGSHTHRLCRPTVGFFFSQGVFPPTAKSVGAAWCRTRVSVQIFRGPPGESQIPQKGEKKKKYAVHSRGRGLAPKNFGCREKFRGDRVGASTTVVGGWAGPASFADTPNPERAHTHTHTVSSSGAGTHD